MFSPPAYWEAVGNPLIHEALARGGFWTEVLDPDAVAKQWQTAPDELMMLSVLSDVMDSNMPGTSQQIVLNPLQGGLTV